MRAFTITLLLLSLFINIQAQSWQLVWQDEFNGNSLNENKWNYQTGDGGWGNNELQNYTDRPENTLVSNGTLKIIAREENLGNSDYTSARITTENKGDWTYAKVEARMKLSSGQGFWPAFWLLPTDNIYGTWPRSGEIDIMEQLGHTPDKTHMTMHYGNSSNDKSQTGANFILPTGDFSQDFHLFGLEWEADSIRWYLDGDLLFAADQSAVAPYLWPFDQKFHIILNLAVGGNWPGPPDATSQFPQNFEVDYVRVYQRPATIKIVGKDAVEINESEVIYSYALDANNYNWTVENGTIISGQGTPSIVVDWQERSGKVKVEANTANGIYTHEKVVAASINLFDNPGFEDGLTNWVSRDGGTADAEFSLITSGRRSQVQSICATVNSTGQNPWDVQIKKDAFALIGGERYTLSFWAKADLAGQQISIYFQNGVDYTNYANTTFSLTDSWKNYTFSFTAPTDADDTNFTINMGSELGTFCFDDFIFFKPNNIKTAYPRLVSNIDPLGNQAHESSGLDVSDLNAFWTHNDANNPAELIQFDSLGNILRKLFLNNVPNLDWEDLTRDADNNLYVGEFGSKSGGLSSNGLYDSLFIHKIPNPELLCGDTVDVETISFTYPHSYIYDTEAMFYHEDYIYLFPKNHHVGTNWQGGYTFLYRVPAQPSTQQYVAEFVDTFKLNVDPLLPIDYFKVAAADISPDGKSVVLLGGRRLWVFYDFEGNNFFDGKYTTYSFENQLQREAAAYSNNYEIYLTDERSGGNPNKGNLYHLDLFDLIPDREYFQSAPTQLLTAQVENYQDAAEEYENGSTNVGSSDLELTLDAGIPAAGNQKIGLRFKNLNLPSGAKIVNAYLQFTTDETSSDASNLTIYGENTGNSDPFASTTNNVSTRIKTSASESWSFAPWQVVSEAGRPQQTPNIAPLVQEIIANPDWFTGNDMAFIIEGTGRRTAESHYHCQRSAPKLYIEYYLPLKADISLWLEGAMDSSSTAMHTKLNTIRNLLPGQMGGTSPTPSGQPYTTAPWYYLGTEGVNTSAYAPDIVDWVLVSIRRNTNKQSELTQAAALLKSDGSLHFIEPLALPQELTGDYYIVVQHRNHMGVISPTPIPVINGRLTIDFRNLGNSLSPLLKQKEISPGQFALLAGEADQLIDAGKFDINGIDYILWASLNGSYDIYHTADLNLDGTIDGEDRALWSENNGISNGMEK